MNTIIAISGKIGSGKSTVTDLIEKHSKIKFTQTAFAKKLKKIVAELCDIEYENTLSQDDKNIYIEQYMQTIGQMYQSIATTLRNHYDTLTFVKALSIEMDNNPDNYLISDLRYKNEAYMLRSKNAILLRVNRDINNDIAQNTTRNINHQSEIELDNYKFDYTILNNGDLKDLENNVIIFLKKYNLYKEPLLKKLIKFFKF